MICKGDFVFKSLTFRSAGKFQDVNGNDVEYPEAYILKVDEINENGEINERKFKISNDKTNIIDNLKFIKSYDKIEITFNVVIFNTRISLEIIDINEVVED